MTYGSAEGNASPRRPACVEEEEEEEVEEVVGGVELADGKGATTVPRAERREPREASSRLPAEMPAAAVPSEASCPARPVDPRSASAEACTTAEMRRRYGNGGNGNRERNRREKPSKRQHGRRLSAGKKGHQMRPTNR